MAIRRVGNSGSALGKAAAVGSIVGAAPTGGLSLLALPGAISALRPNRTVQGVKGGANISQPRQVDSLGKLANVSSLAGSAANISQQFSKSPGPVKDNAATRRQKEIAPDMSDQEIFNTLQAGEQELNQLRLTNPDLAKELERPLFDAILEADKRYKSYGTFRPQGNA